MDTHNMNECQIIMQTEKKKKQNQKWKSTCDSIYFKF